MSSELVGLDGDDSRVPVGKCPQCGYVAGDQLDYNFPNPSECACGTELTNTTVADKETVRDLAENNRNAATSLEDGRDE